MRRMYRFIALAPAFLAALLAACAAYQECGIRGCPGDAALAADVIAAFARHGELAPPTLLTVQSVNHVVYLYGLVDTDFQQQMAESVARQVPGVTRVVNSIGLAGNSR